MKSVVYDLTFSKIYPRLPTNSSLSTDTEIKRINCLGAYQHAQLLVIQRLPLFGENNPGRQTGQSRKYTKYTFFKNAFYFSINIFVKQIIFLKEQDENWCRVNICPSNSKYFLPTSVIRWPGYVSYYLIKTKFYLALWRKSFFFKLAWCPADNDSSLSSCLWFPYQCRHWFDDSHLKHKRITGSCSVDVQGVIPRKKTQQFSTSVYFSSFHENQWDNFQRMLSVLRIYR